MILLVSYIFSVTRRRGNYIHSTRNLNGKQRMRTTLSYHTSSTAAVSIREEDLDTAGVECVKRSSEMRFVSRRDSYYHVSFLVGADVQSI
jgi:hypothetical protein